jgi:hypothetical protein
MSWASLWWRVCLLARLHTRRVRVVWLLWRRSRRTLRVVPARLPRGLPRVRWDLVNSRANLSAGALTVRPGDVIYVDAKPMPFTSGVPYRVGPSAAEARRILDEHEAMLQQQRDVTLKVEA